MTVGMVFWRDMEGILVVVGEFFRIDRGREATVMVGAVTAGMVGGGPSAAKGLIWICSGDSGCGCQSPADGYSVVFKQSGGVRAWAGRSHGGSGSQEYML